MVKRHGKRTTLAYEEEKKRERGECSTGMDELGLHAPKGRRGEGQGLRTHTPGSLSFYF
jgi:hypothetical protein